MNFEKCISLLALFLVLFSTIGPAMADEEDEALDEMEKYLDNNDDNKDGVKVVKAGDSDNNNKKIDPDEIFSEDKVLGQDVKDGSFSDLLTDVKRWVSLLFINEYITAIVGLAFAAMGIVMILLSCGSILKNGISAAGAMLSTESDAEEKLETVYASERGTIAVVRGIGVTFLGLSAIVFMVNFLSGM